MDQLVLSDLKKQAINKITGKLIDALEKEEITREEGQRIAAFVLEKKEKINDEGTLNIFLDSLSKQWSIFEKVAEMQKKTQQFTNIDQQKLDQIKKQLAELTKPPN